MPLAKSRVDDRDRAQGQLHKEPKAQERPDVHTHSLRGVEKTPRGRALNAQEGSPANRLGRSDLIQPSPTWRDCAVDQHLCPVQAPRDRPKAVPAPHRQAAQSPRGVLAWQACARQGRRLPSLFGLK